VAAPQSAARKTSPKKAAKKTPPKKAGAKRKAGPRVTAGVSPKRVTAKRQAPAVRGKSAAATKPLLRRRDGSGHLNAKYAADLLAQSGLHEHESDPAGFIERPRSKDDLAENFGEEFVESATSGENAEEEILDRAVPEERGGPFVETTAGTEFAEGTDASNPGDAEKEPFPTT
jgi:hypothetical protein